MTQDGRLYPLPMSEHRTCENASGLSLPTPTVEDAGRAGSAASWWEYKNGGRTTGYRLRNYIQAWPTPTQADGSGGPSCSGREGGDNLRTAVQKWPTPTASRRSGLQSHGKNAILGQLNPYWVEWLMGWTIGSTSLEPLEQTAIQEWVETTKVGSWWADERDIARVGEKIKDRAARIRALGNGQVPLCVVRAWELLGPSA
jgi:DNA (cytosine-5)-methyltransferase 1